MKSIGLVIAQFYEDIADAIETKAYENADDRGATVAETVYVPGVYDTPLAVDRLAKRDDIDAVVVLGAVITGDTDHDHVIANAAAHKLSDVSLDRNTPVAFGVIGPDMTTTEAWERIEYSADAVNVALDMIDALP